MSLVNAVSVDRQGGEVFTSTNFFPALWAGSAGSWTSVSAGPDPNGYILGMSQGSQVGVFGPGAALWHGTPSSYVNLQPTGYQLSTVALGVSGDQQVGYYAGTTRRALLWHGTADSVIDLTPSGVAGAAASCSDGVHQGGLVYISGGYFHAAMWSGSAGTFVDMNPSTSISTSSGISSMVPGQQVGGFYTPAGIQHAAVWSGTAASMIDLNPFPGQDSFLDGTTGTVQVGSAHVPGLSLPHAGVWFGTATSFVDLHSFLPAGYSSSLATSVVQMPDGSIVIGGWGAPASDPSGRRAFIWVGVPAPATATLLLTVLLPRRRGPRIRDDCRPRD